MSDKSHEWIVISDLMAGMMAVVVLFLVFSVLDKDAEQAELKNTIKKLSVKSHDSVSNVFNSLSKVVVSNNINNTVKLNINTNTMTFTDGVFSNASACLNNNIKKSVIEMRPYLYKFLSENKSNYVMVQGYTNNTPISEPVIDIHKYCAVYDDNITLSAARANAVRKLIVSKKDLSLYKRVVVAAYGDTKPLPGLSPENGKNRRVDVLFIDN